MKLKTQLALALFTVLLLNQGSVFASNEQSIAKNNEAQSEVKKLQNPITVDYLNKNLRKQSPRMVLTPEIEQRLKGKIKSDPLVKNYYAAIKLNAKSILEKPLLTRTLEGRRLLGVSREMLYRMTVLPMVYRIEKDPIILKRIDQEVKAVCQFSDWNPSHYLDVAEMSLAIAFAVDWTGSYLPKSTVDLAKKSLIEKGIKPSWTGKTPGWAFGTNNWNQVCNGGMIAASIVTADINPELATKTISRALEGMPSALKQYSPDGIYPEGTTYWDYGTSFSAVTSSLLTTSFGTDFGIAAYPAFVKSADFRILTEAPSGLYFNFADCGDGSGKSGDITLTYFAAQTGNPLYLQREKFLVPAKEFGKVSRLAGAGLVWLSQFEEKGKTVAPLNWKGEGENPIVIFRGGPSDPSNYYFAGKGGKAGLSHGNMDAGSFVFELNNVRWVIDPGVQDYNALEQAGFDLWGMCQTCQRWSLLTKGNHGHGTLTVDDARFNVNAHAPLISYKESPQPSATFDMSETYAGHLKSSSRTFTKDSDRSILVEDQFVLEDSTKTLTWAIMTTADVATMSQGALLTKEGKQLSLEILSPANVNVSIIQMDPAPSKFDRQIKNLKRIEIRVPAYLFDQKKGAIKVRLAESKTH